jgi:Fe-S-cluster-containing dehydrogenase component
VNLTRRRLLTSCLAIVPSLVGAQMLSRWIPLFGDDQAHPGSEVALAATRDGSTSPDWAFACDTTRCIGCGLCVLACKEENHVPLDTEYRRTWVERHVIASDGAVYVDSPDGGIHGFPPDSTAPGAAGQTVRQAFFVPRLCMQCENPPCVSICPVSATYKTDEGVVLVDEERCIGCGYCVVACPYGARYLVPSGDETPKDTAGVADKCTWCYHRITRGQLPACVEICPAGARVFGDLSDPDSPVSAVLHDQRAQVLRPELGTKPRVYYVGLEAEEA